MKDLIKLIKSCYFAKFLTLLLFYRNYAVNDVNYDVNLLPAENKKFEKIVEKVVRSILHLMMII